MIVVIVVWFLLVLYLFFWVLSWSPLFWKMPPQARSFLPAKLSLPIRAKVLKQLDDIWAELAAGLGEIFHNKKLPSVSYLKLYNNVYNYCILEYQVATHATNFVGGHLYARVDAFLKEHLSLLLHEGLALQDEDLLRFYAKAWDNYVFSCKVLDGVCSYLNRKITRDKGETEDKALFVYPLGLSNWRVVMFEQLKGPVTSAALKLIEKERNGELITTGLIGGVVENYVQLGSRDAAETGSQLSLYQSWFEQQLLEHTAEFYKLESESLLSNPSHSVSDYVAKASARIEQENKRVLTYLNSSTMDKLMDVCDRTLVETHLEHFYREFKRLLDADRREDLARLYRLVLRNPFGVNELKERLEEYIKEKGLQAIERCGPGAAQNPALFLETILSVHCQFTSLVAQSFANDPGFVAAFDKACQKFVNTNAVTTTTIILPAPPPPPPPSSSLAPPPPPTSSSVEVVVEEVEDEVSAAAQASANSSNNNNIEEGDSQEAVPVVVAVTPKDAVVGSSQVNVRVISSSCKSAELLARYCDSVLKKSAKVLSDSEVEVKLDNVMIVFKYLDDKDVFEKYYNKMLARRLVTHLSANDDSEFSMISKLKKCCGLEYTTKLQTMFQDMQLSKDLNRGFKLFLASQKEEEGTEPKLDLDFSVQVLRTGSWPFPAQDFQIVLPIELNVCITRFTAYYNQKYSGRRLNWLSHLSKGELLFKGRYTLQASTYQMALLLQYNNNQNPVLSVQQLYEATQIKMDTLVQVLLILVRVKLLVVEGGDSQKSDPQPETNPQQEATPKREPPKPEDLTPETRLRLFLDYKNKRVRLNINAPLKNEIKTEMDKTTRQIDDDRSMTIQAAVVRIMKTRRSLAQVQLVAEVISLLAARFKPDVKVIKRNIDLLVEKEYLKRADDIPDNYQYVA